MLGDIFLACSKLEARGCLLYKTGTPPKHFSRECRFHGAHPNLHTKASNRQILSSFLFGDTSSVILPISANPTRTLRGNSCCCHNATFLTNSCSCVEQDYHWFVCNRGDTVSRRSPIKGVRPNPYTTLCS